MQTVQTIAMATVENGKDKAFGNEREARRFLNQLWNKRRDYSLAWKYDRQFR